MDDLLEALFGEIALGRGRHSRRAQLMARVVFGLLGTALSTIGAIRFIRSGDGSPALRACIVLLFFFLGCFSLFNVGLGRTWRWPGVLFILSFVALFVTRVVWGP
jgi:hypothetical protein